MQQTPRSVAICLILLWGVTGSLHAQTVPALTPVTGNFKTVYGQEYKGATVGRVEPDGIVLTTKSGISKVYFVELPKDVQERFHYDAAKAAQFTTVQQAAIAESNAAAAAQQQQEAQERQRQAAAIAQKRQQADEQQRQADAIAVRQQQRQVQAQQKQDAKIAAQKQVRERQQRNRRTTGGDDGYSSGESYTRYNADGGYDRLQRSGNARMGSYHHETHGPRSPNTAWTDNVTDASWGPR